ncbi:fumarylacetoacetate hydrolase [Polynucleobacter wuianus]|uniref:Fumarylacetoacetate hydrolase n=1 Tax=Polynucleobacter wuianus TaxID=1743168 RepID=A0A191UE84_9BURK|nr:MULTISPECIES: fumarylacetoacetate hydrolase family protein [Polynucleobacter]ANI99257.1 fumarylacetoacetate hydrolase [Polynucleobacter wuianus]MBU3552156.1 fumarylacetoacetate hydrolase family protein [Polynucleobacter sp. MWH-Post4-6-1]MBU3609591.1 fumarylacetoacetate hydrolase family protein [Polynucleobacter wuianus]
MSSAFVIDPPVQISLPVTNDTRRFAVNRIYCVGRNYADHAREMGHDPDREPPFFFMKPANSIVTDGKDMAYPTLSNDVHHEIEMVVAIGRGGANISADQALDHVYGYGVGLDMTRRDLQGEAKKMGRPWDTGKAFDQSAPCGEITPATQCGHPSKGAVKLLVNGEERQSGDLNQLIWNVPDTIAYLSTLFTLEPGDLIFSGTPAGVGPVKKGDVLEGSVAGLKNLKTKIV